MSYDVMSIPSDLVKGFAASLGYDPRYVRSILVTSMEVTVITYDHDQDGKYKLEPGYKNKAKTERHVHWVAP